MGTTIRPSRIAVLGPLMAIALLAGCAASPQTPKLPKDAGDAGVETRSPSSAVVAPKLIDTSKLDACTLLPTADADTLVAVKLLKPITVSTHDVASCTYASDPKGPVAQVEVYVGDGAKQQLAIDKDKLHHTFIQPTGVGDEAWQEDDWIFARKDATWMSIRIVRLEDASLFVTPLQSAMKAALGRL